MDFIRKIIHKEDPDQKFIDRRKFVRVKVKFKILCIQKEGQAQFEMKTKDISEGGLGFSCVTPVSQGEKIKIIIRSPLDYSFIHVTGKVVWLKKEGGLYQGGIEFTEVSDEDRLNLKKAIDKFKTRY